MRKLVAGIVIGLVLSAGAVRADWGFGDWGTLKEIAASLMGIRVELQRIANAADRLVAIEAYKNPNAVGKARVEAEKRNQ